MEENYYQQYNYFRNSLMELRIIEKEDYQYMIVYNMFYNLSPLHLMFHNIDNIFFTGIKKMDDPLQAAKYISDYQQEILDSLKDHYFDAFSSLGIPIYRIRISKYTLQFAH